jgi:hypothetical protein
VSIARRWREALLATALLHGCATEHGRATAPRRTHPLQHETPRLFVFQDNFWVNLHHFLRAEARRRERGAALVQPLETLDSPERDAWERALDVYRPLAQRSLLFDEDLVRVHVALAAVRDEGALPQGLGAELAFALEAAAPVFRAHQWPARARANDEWIERTRATVERLAPAVTTGLAAAHQLAWPSAPILVDVTPETGPDLAYTTNTAPPGYAGLATINPSVAGGSPAAIECVFHEAAHVLDATLVRWVEEESARQGVEPPPELWHALLFYTAGELSARALGEVGTYREDLARGFPAFLPALDAYWRPYLDGSSSLTTALRELVRSVASDHPLR